MDRRRGVKAEVFRGPFDPGGQPEAATGQPLELSFFAWNVSGGLSATKAVLSDPARYRDYWHWPTASKLLSEADRIGFDHQVQYGMWSGWGGATGWNDAGLGRDQFYKVALGMTGYQLFGGYETVAEKMRALNEVGVDNLVIGFFEPQRALRQMEEHVITILRRMGLRR